MIFRVSSFLLEVIMVIIRPGHHKPYYATAARKTCYATVPVLLDEYSVYSTR
jgi:hypothetical protein